MLIEDVFSAGGSCMRLFFVCLREKGVIYFVTLVDRITHLMAERKGFQLQMKRENMESLPTDLKATSTAITTSAARRPTRLRPVPPAWTPPTQVSSTSIRP